MSFAKLAEELGAQATAMAQATPAAGNGADGAGAGGGAEQPLVKSLVFKLEDGTEVEAVDGATLLKSMQERQDKTDGELMQVIGSLGLMLKSLHEKVALLGNRGAGPRSATVSMPAAAAAAAGKAATPGLVTEEVMAKALERQKEGRMTSLDVATLEGYRNNGLAVPEVMAKSFGLLG